MILNNKIRFNALGLIMVLFLALGLNSCRKESFDEPPVTGADPDLTVNMTIDSLKKMYQDSIINKSGNIIIADDWIIAGTVVGDDRSGNLYKNLILEDATAGIAIRIDLGDFYTTYPVGRRVFVKLKGLVIGGYKGLIQLGGYIDYSYSPPSAATIPSTQITKHLFPGVWGLDPKPSIVTIADLQGNGTSSSPSLLKWQNRLVQINDVEFQAGDTSQTWADAVTLSSKSRYFVECGISSPSMQVYTSGYSTLASMKTPAGNGKIVGVFSVYASSSSNKSGQFLIRTPEDYSDMTKKYCGDGPGAGVISEGFDNITANSNVALPGWTNIAAQGTKYWVGKTFSSEKFAEATAFSSSLPAMETWLITPGFSLSAGDTLSFKSELAFFKHNGLTAWISTDYTGVATDFPTATWTQLTFTLPPTSPNYTWTNSGDIPLTSFSGTGYIGFKYVGDGTTNTTTWRIDNVRVR